ncbi:hypothetical protein NW768_002345 [Fusarium equiseti]|uniref:Beta-glucosidase n=1 Tax=Fusarium equiseti TaxID=61235 RepID=A0ABQ8RNC4_FUSEQ|nr:hypothetical protein NW768_002345 [Fusarium equiseti]
MNLHRYPLCEYHTAQMDETLSRSANPLLSGWVAASFVKGLQAQGVATSLKHFLANETENGRRWSDGVLRSTL